MVEVVNKLISLDELNPFVISYNPIQSSKNDTLLVELQNNNRIGNEIMNASIKTKWEKVNKRNTYKNILVVKTKGNYENYYNKLEELEFDIVTKE